MFKSNIKYILILFFIILCTFFYLYPYENEVDKIFLSISTFLFSIFTGFFISRQGSRYSKIRTTIAGFDGKLSAVYRLSSHLGVDAQEEIGSVILKHYKLILDNKAWDYQFMHKSNTLKSIHQVIDKYGTVEKLTDLQKQSIGGIMKTMIGCQELRKHMISLHQERIPQLQWSLIHFFMIILLFTVFTIPSYMLLLGSILKGAFAVSVISVITILHNLNKLQLFEGTIGENSAQDVIDIIQGEK